jgi:hypothetical protein
MKTVISFFIFFSLAAGLTITNSCAKNDNITGCTDKDSRNYDPVAGKDDGSCLYEGSVVFWYSQSASNSLMADGATALTFFIDGEIIGTTPTTNFWRVSPVCGQAGSVSITMDLGKVKTSTFTVSVKDQREIEYWNTSVNISGNTCTKFQLLWSPGKKIVGEIEYGGIRF